jgi:hypothetical protein
MSLELLGHVYLPGDLKPGGFGHAAVHCAQAGSMLPIRPTMPWMSLAAFTIALAFDSEPDGA